MAERQCLDETVFRHQFIQSHKHPNLETLQAEDQCPSGAVSQRLFQTLPQADPTATIAPGQPKVSKLSKVTLRKNSTRRQVTIKPLPEIPKKQRPKGLHLPPKPTIKLAKGAEKYKALTKLAEIATKDTKEALRRWKRVLPKIRPDQRFNLMVLQPGKLKLYTVKDPRKLYGEARAGEPASGAKERKAFDLMSVKQIEPRDATEDAEQKVLGKKVKVVSKLEKTPI